MPTRGAPAEVLTDEDCAPDASGMSRCRNVLRLQDGRTIPVGREAAASTNPRLDAGILSYSRSKGAFIGAALKGAMITPDNDLNEAVYGKKADAVLKSPAVPFGEMPPSVRIFPRTLVRYSIR